ncbi:MAG: hypothetical protein ABII74_02470 [Elusimicrobiota bacterium]
MNEDAQEIFNYLPINRSKPEAEYIDHLWSAFVALDNTDNSARPFIMMPFHLLFMLAIQFKGIRIAKIFPEAMDLFFASVSGRDKNKLLSSRRSVFDLALVKERTFPELFRLVGFDEQNIQRIKNLIDYRNDTIAHAKGGGGEPDPDGKIEQYLDALRTLQPYLVLHNDRITNQWLSEISDEDDLSGYKDVRLPDSQLCPADFKSGMLAVFNFDDDTPFEEWQSAVSKVLASDSRSGLLWLQHIARTHPDSGWRFKVIQMLDEAGKLDVDFKAALLQNEKNPETIELLRDLGIN